MLPYKLYFHLHVFHLWEYIYRFKPELCVPNYDNVSIIMKHADCVQLESIGAQSRHNYGTIADNLCGFSCCFGLGRFHGVSRLTRHKPSKWYDELQTGSTIYDQYVLTGRRKNVQCRTWSALSHTTHNTKIAISAKPQRIQRIMCGCSIYQNRERNEKLSDLRSWYICHQLHLIDHLHLIEYLTNQTCLQIMCTSMWWCGLWRMLRF